MHRLYYSGLYNPFWRNVSSLVGVYAREGVIITYIGDEEVRLLIEDGEPDIKFGTEVIIHKSNYFYYETYEEHEARKAEEERRKQELQAQMEQERLENAERSRKERREAEEFNSTLRIPVKWTAGIKDVLSGLSANSWGDGRSKSTVEHILLQEDIDEGRFQRRSGSFLCTLPSGSNGKNWSGSKKETRTDVDGVEYIPKITCKACIKLAKRWDRKI